MCRYGSRVPTEHCSVAVVVMSIQSIVGVVIQVSSQKHKLYDFVTLCQLVTFK